MKFAPNDVIASCKKSHLSDDYTSAIMIKRSVLIAGIHDRMYVDGESQCGDRSIELCRSP